MNTKTTLSSLQGRAMIRTRFNPLSSLTPSTLSRALDDFAAGYLREAANIFELLEQRDDLLRGVVSKRKKSVGRHGWTVAPLPNLSAAERAEARRHAAALEYFYNHLECENAFDLAEQGGFKLLVRQMMDAVGKRFAVHEMVWRREAPVVSREGIPSVANRPFVSAKFRFVPLGFFENRTGQLRFLATESALEGTPLDPGAWMVTVGEGLMAASATAWMFKYLSLNDWLTSCQRNGAPALLGISGASAGSAEWEALETSIAQLLEGKAGIIGASDNVRVLDLPSGGHLPFPELVERVDRLLAALWRGADLSTLSRDRGYGASLQEKETCALEEDDALMITETFNRQVDPWVIRHVFGAEARPLARVKVLVAPRECTGDDIQVDEFLLRHGAPLGLEATLNRYGRSLPKSGEKVFLTREQISKASLPESSQNSAWAQHMGNHRPGDIRAAGAGWAGPDVNSRGCSPLAGNAVEISSRSGASLANQFQQDAEGWVQLSPYGDFPHARGLQRMDPAAAAGMVAQFQSLGARAGRLFGGLPFYAGHPDLPAASELADRKAYGWIMELAAREDGLYGRVDWSDAGSELLRQAHCKYLSPFWEAREIGRENGQTVYRPIALLSAGLTNQPNIPVKPLANELNDQADSVEPAVTVAPLPLPTESRAGSLGPRRAELIRPEDRRDRLRESVRARMRLGLDYDEAWAQVKREHPLWFRAQDQ